MGIRLDIEQGTEEWMAWRNTGVGASDTAALFDVSPHKTKRDLWFEKSGFSEGKDISGHWHIRKGHAVEEEIRKIYLDKLGVDMTPACYKEDIMLASLDGENENEGILEAKFVGKEVLKKAHEGIVPPHHNIQVQQQLLITGYDKAHYVCGNGAVYVSVIIKPDRLLQEQIKNKIYEFWELVKTGDCPKLSDKDTLYVTDADQRTMFREFKKLYDRKKQLQIEYEKVEKQIKNFFDHPKVHCEGVTVTAFKKGDNLIKRITVGGE